MVESHLESPLSNNRKWDSETYEDTGTALGGGAFTPQTLNFTIRVYFIVLQDGHLDLLALVLDLLGSLRQLREITQPDKTGKLTL